MNPFEKEAHKTKRQKMGCVSGSPANFESGADKASRFCRGGYADGGSVSDNDIEMDYGKDISDNAMKPYAPVDNKKED